MLLSTTLRYSEVGFTHSPNRATWLLPCQFVDALSDLVSPEDDGSMSAERSNSNKTILLAGDGQLRSFVSAVLTTQSYQIMIADTGKQALEKSLAFDGEIDLLVADVETPEMPGIELAIQLNRHRPDTKILLVAGLASGLLVLNNGWQFLPKPFAADMLGERIRDFLSRATEIASLMKTILYAEGDERRQQLVSAFLTSSGYHIARDGEEALPETLQFNGPIHLLLANLERPEMPGTDLPKSLQKQWEQMSALLLSIHDAGMLVLNQGWQFLPTPFAWDMLRGRIQETLNSVQPAPRKPSVIESGNDPAALSKRETQVLKLIASGHSTKQIAGILGIAFKTSVGHRTRLMKKLGIHDSTTLVRYAIRAGLVEP